VIQLTEKQKMLRDHMTAVELIVEHKHGGVELADFLRVMAFDYGADVVVDMANEVSDKVQQEERNYV
jgi:hypothetical protein